MTAQRSSQGRAAKPGTHLPAARRTAARRTGKGGRSERDRSTRLEAGWRDAVASRAARAAELIAAWAPTAARVLLGLVLAWFGYHELVQPGLWTGYVPLIQPQSAFAIVLVLAHGWLLLMLAVALVAGIMRQGGSRGSSRLAAGDSGLADRHRRPVRSDAPRRRRSRPCHHADQPERAAAHADTRAGRDAVVQRALLADRRERSRGFPGVARRGRRSR